MRFPINLSSRHSASTEDHNSNNRYLSSFIRSILTGITLIVFGTLTTSSYSQSNNDSLLRQQEITFMFLDGTDRVIANYREFGSNLESLQIDTFTNAQGAQANNPIDITSGSYFGSEYGEGIVYLFTQNNKAEFSIDLQSRIVGAIPVDITTPYTSFSVANSGSDIHGTTGNFTGDSKEELIISIYDAPNITNILFEFDINVNSSDTAIITATPVDTLIISSIISSSLSNNISVAAADTDNDNYDELILTYVKSGDITVHSLEVSNSNEIHSRYETAIFDITSDSRCIFLMNNPDNDEDFNSTFGSLSVAAGNFSETYNGDEIVVGASFTLFQSDDNEPELNQGLYMFPLREISDPLPELVIPNWCNFSSQMILDNSFAESRYFPGLNIESANIDEDVEDEIVYGIGNKLAISNIVTGAMVGNTNSLSFQNNQTIYTLSDVEPQTDNSTGPGKYAHQFLSIGNTDPVVSGQSLAAKAEILFGVNKFEETTSITTITNQSFDLYLLSYDGLGGVDIRGQLSDIFPNTFDGSSIDPRRFAISFADLDNNSNPQFTWKNDQYEAYFNLPQIINCGSGESGFVVGSNDLIQSIQTAIDTTSYDKFHFQQQETSKRLSFYVEFDQSILDEEKNFKIKHFRTKDMSDDKELVELASFDIAPGESSFETLYEFIPISGSKDDALIYTIETESSQFNRIIITPLVVTGIDYSVPVLGSTLSPQIPYLVLHDPPGDGSFSEFLSNSTYTRETSQAITNSLGNSTNFALKLGIAGEAGFIVTTKFEFSTTFSAGLSVEKTKSSENSFLETYSITEGFQTSAFDDLGSIGQSGDLFIGWGERYIFGIEKEYIIDPINCTIDSIESFAYATDLNNVVQFALTTKGIEDDIDRLYELLEQPQTSSQDSAIALNQIAVWEKVLERNENNIANANIPINNPLTFNGGGSSILYESEITTINSYNLTYDLVIEANTGIETVVEVGGSGSTASTEFSITNQRGNSESLGESSSNIIKYTMIDDDIGDLYNVNIYRDPTYGTPIFRLADGSKSSCPYEGGLKRDQPNVSADYNQCSFIDNSKFIYVDNIQLGTAAIFTLNLCNDSNEQRSYNVGLYENVNGADVKIANTPINSGQVYTTETINANSCKNFTLTVARNPNLPLPSEIGYVQEYDVYNGLLIRMYPSCFGESPSEQDELIINATFGRNGDYNLGDRDCDGILNIDESCQDDLVIDQNTGSLQGVYSAKNQITIMTGTQFAEGSTVNLNAPIVEIEAMNEVPLTCQLEINSSGCSE